MSTKERDLILLATDLQSSSVGLTKQQLKERVEARTGKKPSTRSLGECTMIYKSPWLRPIYMCSNER